MNEQLDDLARAFLSRTDDEPESLQPIMELTDPILIDATATWTGGLNLTRTVREVNHLALDFLDQGPVVLYRGCLRNHVAGLWWTPDLHVARHFAGEWPGKLRPRHASQFFGAIYQHRLVECVGLGVCDQAWPRRDNHMKTAFESLAGQGGVFVTTVAAEIAQRAGLRAITDICISPETNERLRKLTGAEYPDEQEWLFAKPEMLPAEPLLLWDEFGRLSPPIHHADGCSGAKLARRSVGRGLFGPDRYREETYCTSCGAVPTHKTTATSPARDK